jgi:glycosyltransferase involved in cell wall biosynthesis
MTVSVIIPTFNEEKEIYHCLATLSQQKGITFEVVLVDDGSSDATTSIIGKAMKDFKNLKIKYFAQEHRGPGSARNYGVTKAGGDILVFVDADMIFDEEFIKNLVDPIEKGKSVGTFSKNEMLGNAHNIWARCWNLNRGLPVDRMHPKIYPDKQKVFRAILKSEFQKAGGFNVKAGYSDDWSLSEKLGIEASVVSDALFYHNNPDNLSMIFSQSRWMAKRRYKLGAVGFIVALVRYSLPISIIVGLYKSVRHFLFAFFVFKLVSDLGGFIGVIEYYLFGKVAK